MSRLTKERENDIRYFAAARNELAGDISAVFELLAEIDALREENEKLKAEHLAEKIRRLDAAIGKELIK